MIKGWRLNLAYVERKERLDKERHERAMRRAMMDAEIAMYESSLQHSERITATRIDQAAARFEPWVF